MSTGTSSADFLLATQVMKKRGENARLQSSMQRLARDPWLSRLREVR